MSSVASMFQEPSKSDDRYAGLMESLRRAMREGACMVVPLDHDEARRIAITFAKELGNVTDPEYEPSLWVVAALCAVSKGERPA